MEISCNIRLLHGNFTLCKRANSHCANEPNFMCANEPNFMKYTHITWIFHACKRAKLHVCKRAKFHVYKRAKFHVIHAYYMEISCVQTSQISFVQTSQISCNIRILHGNFMCSFVLCKRANSCNANSFAQHEGRYAFQLFLCVCYMKIHCSAEPTRLHNTTAVFCVFSVMLHGNTLCKWANLCAQHDSRHVFSHMKYIIHEHAYISKKTYIRVYIYL